MTLIKFIAIIVTAMAVNANPMYRYDTKFIKVINDVVFVRKSFSCVILVIDDKIKFVSTEHDAPKKLAKYRSIIKSTNFEIIKSSYEPLSTKDVVEKLSRIGKNHNNFLVYFAAISKKPVMGSIISETTKPVGLVGNLLSSLGLKVQEMGLLPMLFTTLGLDANEKDVKIIEFEY